MIAQATLKLTGQELYHNGQMEKVIVSALKSSELTAFQLVETVKRCSNHPEWRWIEPVYVLIRVDQLIKAGVVRYE
jgi:hypothetical protein